MTLLAIYHVNGATWSALIFSYVLRRYSDRALNVYRELRPFAVPLIIADCVLPVIIYDELTFIHALSIVLDALFWYVCVHNDDDDDDRWRRRRRRITEKIITLFGGRLIVQPA